MKIFAIRDRFVDWYIQPPFFSHSDNQAMANLAELVNGDSKHAIAQAPHHFELWKIGEVDENTGALTESRELVADCSSLIRSGIRNQTEERGGNRAAGGAPIPSTEPSERTSGTTRALASALSGKAPGKAPQGDQQHPGN